MYIGIVKSEGIHYNLAKVGVASSSLVFAPLRKLTSRRLFAFRAFYHQLVSSSRASRIRSSDL